MTHHSASCSPLTFQKSVLSVTHHSISDSKDKEHTSMAQHSAGNSEDTSMVQHSVGDSKDKELTSMAQHSTSQCEDHKKKNKADLSEAHHSTSQSESLVSPSHSSCQDCAVRPKTWNTGKKRKNEEIKSPDEVSTYPKFVVNNYIFCNSPVFTGASTGNKISYDLPMKLFGVKDEKKDDGETDRLLEILKEIQQNSSKVTTMLDVLKQCDAAVIGIGQGCVKLTLRIHSQEGLERLWAMYSSGELERLLKSDLPLDRVNIQERDYQEGCRFFEESMDTKRKDVAQPGDPQPHEVDPSIPRHSPSDSDVAQPGFSRPHEVDPSIPRHSPSDSDDRPGDTRPHKVDPSIPRHSPSDSDVAQPGDPGPHEVDPSIPRHSPSDSEYDKDISIVHPSCSSKFTDLQDETDLSEAHRSARQSKDLVSPRQSSDIGSAFQIFEATALNYVGCRLLTVALLLGLAGELTKHHRNAKAAKISGGAAGIVASGLVIGGFIASFFTFGASLALVGVGAGLGVAGGLTAVGGTAAEAITSKLTSEKAKKIIEQDNAASSKLIHALESLNKSCQDMMAGMTITGGVKVDSITDLVKVSSLTLEAAEGAGKTAFKAVSAAGKAASVAGVVFSVVTVPLDTYMIVSSANYLRKKTVPQVAQCLYDIVEELNCPSETDMRGHIDEIRNKIGLVVKSSP